MFAKVLAITLCFMCVSQLPAQERDNRPSSVQESWSDSVSIERIRRAIERRDFQLADSTLESFEADAHGFLAFLAQLGEEFIDDPRVVQSEELALRIAWWKPNRSSQQLVGRRDTTLLPANVGYYRDRYGVVLDNLPNVIRLGDGFDVADVPHPLSPGSDSIYEYQLGENFTMRLLDREIVVDEIRFRPVDESKARAVGSVYLDRESSAVVRLSLTFTRPAILDKRIETLIVTLENSLVHGLYWLPRRQEVEVVRRSTWLDVPARGIVRGHWEVSGYRVNEGIEQTMQMLPAWSSVSRDSLARWKFDGDVVGVLPSDMIVARDSDVRDAQRRAEDMVRSAALARGRGIAASGRGISDLVRHNRVEGLGVGFGVSNVLPGSFVLGARARYGIDDGEFKGRVSLGKRPPLGGAPFFEMFAQRDYRALGVQERSGLVNSFSSLFFGSDHNSVVDSRSAGLLWRPGASRRLTLSATYDSDSPLGVNARPLSGAYESVLPAWEIEGVRLVIENAGVSGGAASGERSNSWGWALAGAASSGSSELGDDVDPLGMMLSGRWRSEWHLNSGQSFSLSTGGGMTIGSDIPPQWLMFGGGAVTAPGYSFHNFAGKLMAYSRIEWGVPMPFLSIPLGKYGATPARINVLPFLSVLAQEGADENPFVSPLPDGVYTSAGLGFLMFYDLLRMDISYGMRGGGWRFSLDANQAFWGIL